MTDQTQQTGRSVIQDAQSERVVTAPEEMQHTKWNIIIEEKDHGYIVTVGCKCFVIESKQKLIDKLTIYLDSRREIEKAYFAGAFKLD